MQQRLTALDHEWDIERAIEANAATVALIGVLLGAFVNVWFLLLPAAVCTFLLQHALQGWCPPVPILRRLGFARNESYSKKDSRSKQHWILRHRVNAIPAGAGSQRRHRRDVTGLSASDIFVI
jgi:hypothetical protein